MTPQQMQTIVMIVFYATGLVATHYTVRTLTLAVRSLANRP